MLNQIKALLQDSQLRQQIKAAQTLEEVTKLLATAGTEQYPHLSSNDLLALVTGQEAEVVKLSEADLLNVVGGGPTAGGCYPTVTSCSCNNCN